MNAELFVFSFFSQGVGSEEKQVFSTMTLTITMTKN